MTFTKQIAPASNGFLAQIKMAYIVPRAGKFMVTVMQTNSNGLDCQWFADNEAEVTNEFLAAGYQIEAAA
jgi:hypothetical protein